LGTKVSGNSNIKEEKLQAEGSRFHTNLGIPVSKSRGEPSIFPQQQA